MACSLGSCQSPLASHSLLGGKERGPPGLIPCPEPKDQSVAWGDPRTWVSPWGVHHVFVQHMLCSLRGLWPLHTIIWCFVLFCFKVPKGNQGLQDLKNNHHRKEPQLVVVGFFFPQAFLMKCTFCALFLKLQMLVVPN